MTLPIKMLLLLLVPAILHSQSQEPPSGQYYNGLALSENGKIDSLKNQLNAAKYDTSRIRILGELGLLYEKLNADSSLKYGMASIELAKQGGYLQKEGRALAGLSGVLREQGKFTEALEVLFRALKIAEELNVPRDIARCNRRIGAVYRELENYPKALEYSSKALREDLAINNSSSAMLDHMDLGHLYERLDQLDSALYHANLALSQMKETDNFRPMLIMIFGNIYFKKGNYSLASSYYHNGLEICKRIGDLGTASRICRDLAQLSIQIHQIDSALYYASTGLQSAKKSSYKKGIIHNGIILGQLMESEQPAEALQYYKMAYAAKDSLFGPSNIETLQDLVSREEVRQKELEAARVAFENQLRSYILLSGLGLLLVVAVILFRNNRQKQKANTLLSKQKEEIQSTLFQLKSTQSQLIQSEKMASLGELTAGIAHEIQNPLNFVNNFAELNKELNAEGMEAIRSGNMGDAGEVFGILAENNDKILQHGKRADAIVKGMLQHSQKASGAKEPTNINALADEYLRLAYHGFKAKDKSFNVVMKTDFDQSVGKIDIIPQEMGRVLLNLVNNAFYAVNEKKKNTDGSYEPEVTLSTRMVSGPNHSIIISVKDNGNGIPQNIVDKIFQPFFTTKPTGQGTGLGLSLSYDIVKAHGGEIIVESKEGEGTIFSVVIPVGQA